MRAIGVDIGGTSCSVCVGDLETDGVVVRHRTPPRATADHTPLDMLRALAEDIGTCRRLEGPEPAGIGISCGGPLDSRRGLVLSPPNLPGWDELPVVSELSGRTQLPAWLCNDANAGALAEWLWGAGRGCRSMIFLTFGTGLGAGLILGGRLYCGASDSAGEAGHIRLAPFGPVGFGKAGSFEGFCSGGGIAQLARAMVLERLQAGERPALCPDRDALGSLTAERVGRAADAGDALAREILAASGRRLGQGLAVLVDLLNPEKIVIGSIFARCHDHIWPSAREVLHAEALPSAREACEVVPSRLGESVGDVAALTVAYYYRNRELEDERP